MTRGPTSRGAALPLKHRSKRRIERDTFCGQRRDRQGPTETLRVSILVTRISSARAYKKRAGFCPL